MNTEQVLHRIARTRDAFRIASKFLLDDEYEKAYCSLKRARLLLYGEPN
jgi:hypothetical protein